MIRKLESSVTFAAAVSLNVRKYCWRVLPILSDVEAGWLSRLTFPDRAPNAAISQAIAALGKSVAQRLRHTSAREPSAPSPQSTGALPSFVQQMTPAVWAVAWKIPGDSASLIVSGWVDASVTVKALAIVLGAAIAWPNNRFADLGS